MGIDLLPKTRKLLNDSKRFKAKKRGFEIAGAEGVLKAKPSYYLNSEEFSKDANSLELIQG